MRRIPLLLCALAVIWAADVLVRFDVFDILGRRVAAIFNGVKSAGQHRVVWDASRLTLGIYFYRLSAGRVSRLGRCLLIK